MPFTACPHIEHSTLLRHPFPSFMFAGLYLPEPQFPENRAELVVSVTLHSEPQ